MAHSKKLFNVRRLRAGDVRSYRGVLVEALIVHPDCFLKDYNAEISRPLAEIEEELEQSGTFGAWFGGLLVGIASEVPCTEAKLRNCGKVQNLYVLENIGDEELAAISSERYCSMLPMTCNNLRPRSRSDVKAEFGSLNNSDSARVACCQALLRLARKKSMFGR
jgi:hypothetical protein